MLFCHRHHKWTDIVFHEYSWHPVAASCMVNYSFLRDGRETQVSCTLLVTRKTILIDVMTKPLHRRDEGHGLGLDCEIKSVHWCNSAPTPPTLRTAINHLTQDENFKKTFMVLNSLSCGYFLKRYVQICKQHLQLVRLHPSSLGSCV